MCNRDDHFIFNQSIASGIGVDAAIVLQKIRYWINCSGKKVNAEKGEWIYNSLEEWHKQFSFWSLSKLRRIINSLETKKLIISKKINSQKWNQTKWYSINLETYNKLFDIKDLVDKKRTDRFVHFEQMLLKKTKNNYTNKSSYKKKEKILKINKNQKEAFTCSKLEKTILSQEQKDIAMQMVQVWNNSFDWSLSPIKAFVNKHVAIQLNKMLETKFNNDLGSWEQYAKSVNSSKFLMGEKETKSNFKAQFLWLIKEETIDSIQSGAYGVGDRILDSDKIEENLKVCQKEIQQIVQTKMTERVQKKTSTENEEKEFKKYLINREYIKDGDQYLVRKHMETIGSEYMYGGYITPSHVFYPGNEKYRKRLFASYLMKKHYGIDELGITSSFENVTKGLDGKSLLLRFKSIREKLKIGVLQNSNYKDTFFGSITEKIADIPPTGMLN
jgi:hypothetical protein